MLPSDPGSLDPDLAYIDDALEVDYFLYDSLINFTPSGKVESNLASSWSGTTTTASYTLKKGVTCSDGSPLTASTVAANINFVANPKNASSRLGSWAPAGATAAGDDKTGVVTVKSPSPDAFLVTDVGQALIVCGNGNANRSTLKQGADGTGMYTLSSAVPGSSYTLTLRKGRPGRLPQLERGRDGALQERRPGAVRRLGDHHLRQGRQVPAEPGRHPAVLDPDARLGA